MNFLINTSNFWENEDHKYDLSWEKLIWNINSLFNCSFLLSNFQGAQKQRSKIKYEKSSNWGKENSMSMINLTE